MPHVLVVEDDEQLRAGLRRALEREGYDVLTADEGGAAIALLEWQDVDLVITDINMPEVDGIELILSLRQIRPELPVLAISGGGFLPQQHLLDDAIALGATEVLLKPFPLPAMLEVVERLLA